MHTATVGWYEDRNKAFVQPDKGIIEASFDGRPTEVRVEGIEGAVILTPHKGPSFLAHPEYYMED